jgi:hypothetical protein
MPRRGKQNWKAVATPGFYQFTKTGIVHRCNCLSQKDLRQLFSFEAYNIESKTECLKIFLNIF